MAAGKAESKPPNSGLARLQDLLAAIAVWGRLVIGLALSTIGGVAFGHAWTTENGPWWWVGSISLLTGVLLILSAVYTRGHRPEAATQAASVQEDPMDERGPAAPLVGALLVYKYRLITDEQLKRALDEQRKHPGERRLGEILVGMGLITRGQLREALRFQRSYLARKRAREESAKV